MGNIKQKTIPDGYEMVFFWCQVIVYELAFKKTIYVTLERIYDHKESTLTLHTKNVHFTFDNQVYQQNDGVAMGSPLGPVLAGIFMAELETRIIPTLGNMDLDWKMFVDDTIDYVKNGSIDIILSNLNSFHPNI